MSWWVGKDRESFNVALQEHADHIMRGKARGQTAAEPPPEAESPTATAEAAVPPQPEPIVSQPEAPLIAPVISKQKRYRQKLLAAGLCERCGEPRQLYARCCNRCEGKQNARRQYRSWMPGSRGTAPKWARPFLAMAIAMRTAILESHHAEETPALGRAAVVMFCGFLLGQREDWIVAWTGYAANEVKGIIRNLHRAAIWIPERRIACKWLDAFEHKRLSKSDRAYLDMAFWLDACVAQGTFTRETREGEFCYGLPEWLRSDEARTFARKERAR